MRRPCTPLPPQALWDVLPYEEFSLRVSRHDLHRIVEIIDDVTPQQVGGGPGAALSPSTHRCTHAALSCCGLFGMWRWRLHLHLHCKSFVVACMPQHLPPQGAALFCHAHTAVHRCLMRCCCSTAHIWPKGTTRAAATCCAFCCFPTHPNPFLDATTWAARFVQSPPRLSTALYCFGAAAGGAAAGRGEVAQVGPPGGGGGGLNATCATAIAVAALTLC